MNVVKLRSIGVSSRDMGPQLKSAEEQYRYLVTQLTQKAIQRQSELSELEELVVTEGRELLRRLLEETIRNIGEGDVGETINNKDEKILSQKRLRSSIIKTTVGEVKNERIGYSQREEKSIFPKDIQLNLADSSYSHLLRKRVAFEVSRVSFSSASEAILLTQGVQIHNRQIEEIAISAAVDFDEFYQQQQNPKDQVLANELPLLVMSTDGKGISMLKEDLTEETQKRAENSAKKLKHRLSKGEKSNYKRMATVAAVYSIDIFVRTPGEVMGELDHVKLVEEKIRPRPVCKRVWASIEHSNEETIMNIFEEAIRRDPNLKKDWVMLVDGSETQLKRAKKLIKKTNKETTIVLDIIHVIEYLWKAARAFYEETSEECEHWVKEKLHEILKGNVGHTAAGIRRSATNRGMSKKDREPIDKCSAYLLKYSKYMRYDEYLSRGFPIATGVIEGACRHIIKDRMDITGARWSIASAEAVLKLRSLKSSRDFEDYWDFHKIQENKRNYGGALIQVNGQNQLSQKS